METERDQILTQNQMEKEEMQEKFDREKDELEQELAATQKDRDDSLMFAENEKQQVWCAWLFDIFFGVTSMTILCTVCGYKQRFIYTHDSTVGLNHSLSL